VQGISRCRTPYGSSASTIALTTGGGEPQSAVNRAARHDIHYSLEKTIAVKDAPVIEIYRR